MQVVTDRLGCSGEAANHLIQPMESVKLLVLLERGVDAKTPPRQVKAARRLGVPITQPSITPRARLGLDRRGKLASTAAAVNALTAKLAAELDGSGILVNAVCPGLTATAPGMEAFGARPIAEGAASIVWAATLSDDGPTGGFFRDGKPLPW